DAEYLLEDPRLEPKATFTMDLVMVDEVMEQLSRRLIDVVKDDNASSPPLMHSRLASHNRTINLLDQEFDLLIGSLRKLTTSVPLDLLYSQPGPRQFARTFSAAPAQWNRRSAVFLQISGMILLSGHCQKRFQRLSEFSSI